MILQPLKKTKLYEEIIAQIVSMIRSGALKPGDKLPTERQLCEQLNVSRAALREALRVLESVGYIESRVGDGTFIREISLDDLFDPFSDVFAQNDEIIPNLVEVRLILDPKIAAIATEKITLAQIDDLDNILHKMTDSLMRGEKGILEDEEFHIALAKSTNNKALYTIYEMCRRLLSETINTVLHKTPFQSQIALQEHYEILTAIKNKDATLASRLMKDHLERNFTNILYLSNKTGSKTNINTQNNDAL